MSERSCHNCGLRSGATSSPGLMVRLALRPMNGFERKRRVTVWCHSDECALQVLAVAQYGPATHKWPLTLTQFRAMNRLDRAETYAQTRIKSGAAKADFQIMGSDALPGFPNARKRVGGRPRKWRSDAERMRTFRRNRRRAAPAVSSGVVL